MESQARIMLFPPTGLERATGWLRAGSSFAGVRQGLVVVAYAAACISLVSLTEEGRYDEVYGAARSVEAGC